MTKTKTLSDTITIKLDGEDRNIFLSFGLLNELSLLVNDISDLPSIPLNTRLRKQVLSACFATRKKSGKIEAEVDIDDVDVSIGDSERIIDWVVDHMMAFFLRSLKKVVLTTEANKIDMQDLGSSLNGLKA